MNDQVKLQVLLEFETEGADRATKAAGTLQEAVDELGRQGIISTQDQNKYSRALSGTATSAREASASLPTLRYAMYDVAQTAGIMSAAIGAAGTAAIMASSSFESSFTAVERTSGAAGAQALKLRDDLIDLSRAIPQSFGEIANIAARGAQLGIATQELDDFTNTVAQFVATSDTVTLDQAVEAFGRISNLLGDKDFNRIGSAITLVGVNAAATEAQIVKTTQELAPFATAVGMSADETIGLAAALGSLGQPPERARSAFLTLQRVMDNAIASGSENLHAFASLLNTTTDEVTRLWKQDPSQFIESFARSLGGVEDLTTAFADLGINERRAVQVFQALAADSRNAGDGLSVLSTALMDSAQGYAEGTELARQYGLIVDDLASKWQLFLNAVQEFAATTGDALAPLAKGLLDIATAVVQFLTDLTKTPAGKFLAVTVASVGALTFALTASVASIALFVASMAAARTGLSQMTLASSGSIISLKALSAEFTALATTAGVSSRALHAFKIALASTGIGLAVVALGALSTAFLQSAESADEAFSRIVGSAGGLSEAVAQDTQDYLDGVAGSYTELTPVLEQNTDALDDNSAAIQGAAIVLGIAAPELDNVSNAVERNTQVLGDNAIAWLQNQLIQSEAFQELAGNAEFVDYWQAIGADFVEVTHIAATEGEQAVLDYFLRLEQAYEEGQRRLGAVVTTTQGAFDSRGNLQAGWMGGRGLGGGVFGTRLGKSINDITKLTSGWKGQLDLLGTSNRKAAAAVDDLDDSGRSLNDTFNRLGGSGGGSTGRTTEKIRTLLDYSGDLANIWRRAFEIRFSGQQTLDAVTSSIISMRDALEEARKRVRDLKNDIRSLTADIDIQEYFLSIAIEYGDTKRAAAIEADLAKKRAELADKSSELKKQQDAASTSLVGNTKGAIDNRKSVTDLVQQYQAHIGALAASGMSSADLSRATERLRQDFIQQLTQMGYNRAEAEKYAKAFDDVRVAIANVPRNITVSANVNPAIQALNEFKDQASRAGTDAARNFGNNFKPQNYMPSSVSMPRINASTSFPIPYNSWQSFMSAMRTQGFGSITNRKFLDPHWDALFKLGLSMGYASGGFTGSGGKYEPAGIVHRGEYVIPKKDVNQATGLPYADALGRLMTGVRGFATGGPTVSQSSSVSQVALTPGTIQAIAHAVKPMLYLDGNLIAESSSSAYAHGNTVGSY